ncbi:hypothetical protein ACFFU9_12375 [Mariniflexile ostreae]|uniref:Membrane protein DUF2306 n=1 Tax=Mariniflexile ostreae TaxID=1520892 RepID=A0ABV5FDM8_9FLAO
MSDSYYFLYYLIHLLELTAAILALIHYKKYKSSTERYFLHFLWLTFIFDTVIGVLIRPLFEIDNTWAYYIYTGISFLFYYWWYHSVLLKTMYKRIILVFGFLFFIVYFFNFTKPNLHQYSFITGAFFLLILTGLYLHQLFNADYILNLKYKLSFWITIALVLFNISMIPFILLSEYFNFWVDNPIFVSILFFLNVVLYGCYMIGFIWTKKKYNHF